MEYTCFERTSGAARRTSGMAGRILKALRRTLGLATFSVIIAVLALSFLIAAWAAPAAALDSRQRGERSVYLIRHGDYDQDDERDPDVGKALTPLGIAQARLVAARLRSLPAAITSLHSSTMTRARETAVVIGEEFPGLELQTSSLLCECTPPTWRRDIMASTDSMEAERCRDRLEKAFEQYFAPSPEADSHDVIVCHGNVIRYFVTRVLGVDPMAWLGMSIANCSLTTVKIRADGSMKLLFYADVGHVPPNLQTGLDGKIKDLVVTE